MAEGRCLCGAVGYRLSRPVEWIVHCPCLGDERYVTGVITVPADRFELLRGGDCLRLSESGRWELCERCGTTVFFHGEGAEFGVCVATVPELMPDGDALHRAVAAGRAERARTLIHCGMNTRTQRWDRPLWKEAKVQDVRRLLLEHGGRASKVPKSRDGFIRGACRCEGVQIEVELPLLPARDVPANQEVPAWHRCVWVRDSQFRVLKGGRLLRTAGLRQGTSHSCKRCQASVFLKLSNCPDATFVVASRLEHLGADAELVSSKRGSEAAGNNEEALMDAVRDDNLDEVKKLLEQGVPIDPAPGKTTPLEHAMDQGHIRMCRLLISHGADVTRVESVDTTSQQSYKLYRLLLEHGADPQKLLPAAVRFGDVRSVRILLDAGADVNVRDGEEDWVMPLHWAAHNSSAMIRLLIRRGADVTRLSKAGGHALGFCALWGKVGRMRTLVECGFPVDLLQATPEYAALYAACLVGETESVRVLLELGADPNLGYGSSTPLMVASRRGSLEIVELLLKQGANPVLRDDEGLTALDYAKKHPQIAARLREAVGE